MTSLSMKLPATAVLLGPTVFAVCVSTAYGLLSTVHSVIRISTVYYLLSTVYSARNTLPVYQGDRV